MRYSPEALTAFVEAVAAGSFSAAARRLRKSQSTISTSIAHLEADLGFELFDRSARQPVLTAQGEQVLGYVQAILAASTRLDELAVSLTAQTEARLTFVLSDTLNPDVLEEMMKQFDARFPHTEFECLIGEEEDVIDLLQKERAQVGLTEAGQLPHRYWRYPAADADPDGNLCCDHASPGGPTRNSGRRAARLARTAAEHLSGARGCLREGPSGQHRITCYS
jgi:DNA-binding transcriptional LysR family regulator